MHASLRTIFLGGQTDWHDNLITLWHARSPAPRGLGRCILIPFGLGVCPCSVSPLGQDWGSLWREVQDMWGDGQSPSSCRCLQGW